MQMADASLEQLLSEQEALLGRIHSETNVKLAIDGLATLVGNVVTILRRVDSMQEERGARTSKQIDAVREFMKADSERISGSLDRMAAQLEATAHAGEMRAEFAAVRQQMNVLLGLVQPR